MNVIRVLDIIYEVFPEAVLCGGTAIWKYYNGTKFRSLDLAGLPG